MQTSGRVVAFLGRSSRCSECAVESDCLAIDPDSPEGAQGVPPRVHRRGEHLYRGGEHFENLYLVRSGSVKAYLLTPSGEEQVVGFHGAGDVIGLDAIASGTHVSSALSLDTSSVCALPYERLARLCARSPTIHARLMRGVSRRLLHDEALLMILGRKSADERIASFLLDQAEHQHRQGYSSRELNLAMSRGDIASYLALAVETVSRVLTRMQEQGLLSVDRSRVRILDLAGLQTTAGDRDRNLDSPPRASRQRRGER
jgi:CRP/FNR family transcriptional regulator, anaerobic regulatory protein